MIATLLIAALSTASAADLHVEGRQVAADGAMAIESARLKALVDGVDIEADATCDDVRRGLLGERAVCTLSGVSLSAEALDPQFEDIVETIMADWERALDGAEVSVRWGLFGRARVVHLDAAVALDVERDAREASVQEDLRAQVAAAFDGVDPRGDDAVVAGY